MEMGGEARIWVGFFCQNKADVLTKIDLPELFLKRFVVSAINNLLETC